MQNALGKWRKERERGNKRHMIIASKIIFSSAKLYIGQQNYFLAKRSKNAPGALTKHMFTD
ncbi:hypothetical protein BpHYR1_001030 [Brachionus plicatilis]|uniref:Uncharacterized protein n=1 Tax=Brachionus plicatilis TaxID=10195 RepID=A0A3M7QBR8_BRAPC|nr:hypothetical protein BpHYR1_001030 [Brachionus plicatilis]